MTEAPDPPAIHVVGAAILRAETCLVVQRGKEMSTPLKWEFPGGKVEAGEGPREALRREIREELALTIEVGDLLGRGTAAGRSGRIVLDVYRARVLRGELKLREHRQALWLGADELEALDWAAADVAIVGEVKSRLRQLRE